MIYVCDGVFQESSRIGLAVKAFDKNISIELCTFFKLQKHDIVTLVWNIILGSFNIKLRLWAVLNSKMILYSLGHFF